MHCHHSESSILKVLGIIGMVIAGTIGAIVFGLVFGYFVQLLWNWLMPTIFGLGKISYWQGFGLVLLARLIVGSPGAHFGRGWHHRGWHHHGKQHFHHHPGRHDDCGEEWRIKGSLRNWDYYDDWWRIEGKEAFENYIEKVEKPETKEENTTDNRQDV